MKAPTWSTNTANTITLASTGPASDKLKRYLIQADFQFALQLALSTTLGPKQNG